MEGVRQILAVARMEFRFAFRRSAPVAVTALTGLLVGTGIVLLMMDALRNIAGSLTFTPEQQARWLEAGLTLEQHARFVANGPADLAVFGTVLGGLLMFVALLLLPAASIPAIPADRVFGTAELLRSTPLTGGRYLAGKALGLLAAVALTGAVMLGLFFAAVNIVFMIHLRYGLPWNAGRYFLELALLDGSLFLAWGAVFGVLLGVFFRTRRAAIFPGLLAGGVSLVFWLAAFHPPATDAGLVFADRIHYYLFQNYPSIFGELNRTLGFDPGLSSLPRLVGIGQVAAMILTVVGALLVLGLLARLWLQWKENF